MKPSMRRYPEHIIAEARALVMLGHSYTQAAKAIQEKFGVRPGKETIREWVNAWSAGEGLEEMRLAELRIARRLDGIVDRYLDRIERGEAKPHFSQVMLGWGLAHDKVRHGFGKHPSGQQTTIVIVPGQVPTGLPAQQAGGQVVEGEARVVED